MNTQSASTITPNYQTNRLAFKLFGLLFDDYTLEPKFDDEIKFDSHRTTMLDMARMIEANRDELEDGWVHADNQAKEAQPVGSFRSLPHAPTIDKVAAELYAEIEDFGAWDTVVISDFLRELFSSPGKAMVLSAEALGMPFGQEALDQLGFKAPDAAEQKGEGI